MVHMCVELPVRVRRWSVGTKRRGAHFHGNKRDHPRERGCGQERNADLAERKKKTVAFRCVPYQSAGSASANCPLVHSVSCASIVTSISLLTRRAASWESRRRSLSPVTALLLRRASASLCTAPALSSRLVCPLYCGRVRYLTKAQARSSGAPRTQASSHSALRSALAR